MVSSARQTVAMPFYTDKIYPLLVSALGNPEPIREIRQKTVALEPNPAMIRLAEQHRSRVEFDVEFLDLPDGSIDTVVSTFTLCTIPGVVDAIRGIARVLRPGGKLIFFEQQVSPDIRVQRWQKRWEPIHRIFAGLRLSRDISSLIANSGFDVEQSAGYLAPFPKSWTYCCWGTAVSRMHNRRA